MANISPKLVEERIRRFGKLWMVDDLIRERARDKDQVPILGYPKYNDTVTEYEYFTGKDLDRMIDEACRSLMRAGIEMNCRKTVALYAPSDLSFVVTFFALFRLGCKVLCMSIRLGLAACLHLLKRAECDIVLYGATARINSTVAGLKSTGPHLKLMPMLTRTDFDAPTAPREAFERPIRDMEAEHVQVTLIMHSSGSTGLPKPLMLSHRSVTNTLVSGTELSAFNALPWYHLHGLITSIQAMWMRKPAHLYNVRLPLTADNLISALNVIKPGICHCVPYVLKLIAERDDGVEMLKQCRVVTSAGARTPDELGDRLVKHGVRLGLIFGLTEVGHMGDSIQRDPDDESWNYIRPFGNLHPHMFFQRLSGGIYESVYLQSHPALMITNSDDPPGSFHSGDLFTPHPTIENAWKYVARGDDRITLLSGEKILPLALEGAIRESLLVRDVLMVGNDRLAPGLLVFRSESSRPLPDEEYIKAIWPNVDAANRIADEFARLTPDMIMPIAPDVEYPATDKNNIIRAAAYQVFEDAIESLYKDVNMTDAPDSKKLSLSIEGLEKYILRSVLEQTGIELLDLGADFFAAGVDSLRAAQLRRLLQRDLDLGGHVLTTNILYDTSNVMKLARKLYAMRTGENLAEGQIGSSSGMKKLIQEYGRFGIRIPGQRERPEKDVVVLTGASGALGAHILNQLLDDPKIRAVICLVRGNNTLGRVAESLKARGLGPVAEDQDRLSKLKALTSDNLGAQNLGLSPEEYASVRDSATLIIHAAWPVNFNISLESLVPQLAGLQNLLELALSSPYRVPAKVLFTSSISTAFQMPRPATVPEAPLESVAYAAATGYAQSKLIGEHICASAAASGLPVGVLRIGQISADTVNGIWNEKEAIPLMVRSARELRVLPRLDGDQGRCEWMPVDTVAAACIQLADKIQAGTGSPAFYNVTTRRAFSWNDEFLPALRAAGMDFEDVDLDSWLASLRLRAVELGPAAEEILPAIKLAEYYDTFRSSNNSFQSGLRFDSQKACRDSKALEFCPHVLQRRLVSKMVKYWTQIGRDDN